MIRTNLFDLYAKISLDTSSYDKGVANSESKLKTFSTKLKTFSDKVTNVAKTVSTPWTALAKGVGAISKGVVVGIGAIGAAAGAGIAALNGIAESTEEYRIAQGKLNTAFDSAGFSAESAQEAYSGFYGILGDTDTATEASQLLAKLAQSEEDISKWTDIAAGVYGTFGDSLPIEGLIEASNETAKVGQVTGVLADALNWAGISEDAFNEQLAACSDETERNQLIMETLSGTYDEASEAFYKNNEQLVKSRENQDRLNQTLAKVGTAFENAKTVVMSGFMPAIEKAGSKVASFIDKITNAFQKDGLSGAVQAGASIIAGLVSEIANRLPEIVEAAKGVVMTLVQGISENLPEITKGAAEAISTFVSGALEMFPDVFQLGLEFIIELVEGIAANIDKIVDSAVETIKKLVEILSNPESTDRLISAALDIMLALSEGLIEALPVIISSVPKIVLNIVSAFWDNRDKILEIGKNIVIAIKDGILAAWDGLVSWFTGLWDMLFGNKSVDVEVNASNNTGVNGSHASGLNYVPFDGYIARLHKGERVLTAEEASVYRNGTGTTINQYIQAVPMTPAELARKSVDAYDRLRWAY